MGSPRELLVESFRSLDAGGTGTIPRTVFVSVLREVCQENPAWMESLEFLMTRVDGSSVRYAEFLEWIYTEDEEEPAAKRPALPEPGKATDEEILALRRLTPEQQAAKDAADRAAVKRDRAREEVPEEMRNSEEHLRGWERYGGDALEHLFEHTPLVDVQYLIDLVEGGGVLPRKQEVPLEAFITKHNLWVLKRFRNEWHVSLPIVVLSYPWLDFFHPDRLGAQMRRLLPIFRVLLRFAQKTEHGTMGVMIDFVCLPQKPFASAELKAAFGTSLSTINEWYVHTATYVLSVTMPAPQGEAYSNPALHESRGWCFFEKMIASIVTTGSCLWDASRYEEGLEAQDYRSVCDRMKGGRAKVLSPPAFAEQMRSRVASGQLKFTANADMETVIEQYRLGFVISISTTIGDGTLGEESFIPYWHLDWTDEEGESMLEALEYAAEHCARPEGKLLDFDIKEGNSYSKEFRSKVKAFNAKAAGKLLMITA